MNLKGGEPYRYIIREFCPLLRKAICKIDFDVRNFSIEQAKEVFKSRPQNLSLNEMFLVANTYEKGSQEFIDLFETAVKLYPDDVTGQSECSSSRVVTQRYGLRQAIFEQNRKITRYPRMPQHNGSTGNALRQL